MGLNATYLLNSKLHFFAIGLSYKKADATIRGHFSVNEEAQMHILEEAKKALVPSLTVISTCNRTELYGFAPDAKVLIKILCEYTHGTVDEFMKVAYIYKGQEAIDHLFKVGTGLDSQILGDFEIIGQLKLGFKKSKKLKLMNPFMERP